MKRRVYVSMVGMSENIPDFMYTGRETLMRNKRQKRRVRFNIMHAKFKDFYDN